MPGLVPGIHVYLVSVAKTWMGHDDHLGVIVRQRVGAKRRPTRGSG